MRAKLHPFYYYCKEFKFGRLGDVKYEKTTKIINV